MHQALYRKWRPKSFDDVCGQEQVTSVLRYETEHHTFSHAYLFCGSRGTGKTTCAKILAKAVNCEHPINGSPCGECSACRAIEDETATDVLEIDAASNNGVENIRSIRDEVVYAPSALRYRVYIVDEVHMLSIGAFNALLKTLEEPPEHVVFILATTDLQKVPATIISRCQRFDFRRISVEALSARLQYIADQEEIEIEPDAVRIIAKQAQGGMRDAISLLELCAGYHCKITAKLVSDAVGTAGRGSVIKIAEAIAKKDYDGIFSLIDATQQTASDLLTFWQDVISLWRDLLVIKATKNASKYLDLTDDENNRLCGIADKFSKEILLYHTKLLEDALFAMQKSNAIKRIVAEMTLVRMCDETMDTSNEALLSRISKLEEKIALGFVANAEKSDNQPPTPTETAPESEKKPAFPANDVRFSLQEKEKRILKPFRNWLEISDRVVQSNPAIAAFLKRARAFTTQNGDFIVRFDSTFSQNMVEKVQGRQTVRAILASSFGMNLSDSQLLFESEDHKEPSVFDEIISATEDENQ